VKEKCFQVTAMLPKIHSLNFCEPSNQNNLIAIATVKAIGYMHYQCITRNMIRNNISQNMQIVFSYHHETSENVFKYCSTATYVVRFVGLPVGIEAWGTVSKPRDTKTG
jgi:hypothetical protein